MKLKYYLRGLGIGIVVSTLIMGIIFSSKNSTLSDEEVMVRAAQLGMVKSSTLTDSAETLDETSTADLTQEAATADTENTAATTDATAEDASANNTANSDASATDITAAETDKNVATDSTTQTMPTSTADTTTPTDTTKIPTDTTTTPTNTTTAPAVTTTSETTTTVTLSIVGGDSSVGVSNKLANAGLVDSATNFDKYLCANGYDKTLRVGTYQIPLGATEEEIAKIIAK